MEKQGKKKVFIFSLISLCEHREDDKIADFHFLWASLEVKCVNNIFSLTH